MIDISVEFVDLMARNIIQITLGEDINDEKFEIKVRESPESSTFVVKKVKLSEAI